MPVFLLQGTAKYLFSPLSLSVCVSLVASLALSFTLVPVLFASLMRSSVAGTAAGVRRRAAQRSRFNVFGAIHHGFESGFNDLRESLSQQRRLLRGARRRHAPCSFFVADGRFAACCFPNSAETFSRRSTPARCGFTFAPRPASRIEETQRYFAEVESAIRQIVGQDQIDVILDNIGLPYSGINIALSDSATVGPMDGEILISLKRKHSPTAAHIAALRRELPKRFPALTFFFQPADIVNQVLNFGQPAPIDVRIAGPNGDETYALAQKISRDLGAVPGSWIRMCSRCRTRPR